MKRMSDLVRQFNETVNSISPSEYERMIDRLFATSNLANVADIALGDKAVLGSDLSHTQPEVQHEATN